METKTEYMEPVSRLLEIGQFDLRKSIDYREYGISSQDIPELIKLVGDLELVQNAEATKSSWGPIHALLALGQLHAEEAIDPLVGMFPEMKGQDWFSTIILDVLAEIGPAALPALTTFLADQSQDYLRRGLATECIEKIGRKHPEARERCIQILVEQLKKYNEDDITLNGFVVSSLVDLQAKEALPLIREAFELEQIDEGVIAWSEVRREKEKWYKKYQTRHRGK